MRIMLFGGSFDPPHNGHKQIAEEVIKENLADQVWFLPCFSHPFSKTLSPSGHRLNMTRLLTNHSVLTSEYEIEKGGTSFSYDTLIYFQQTQPQHTFSWFIGSDQLESFHKWKNYNDILKATQVYVYPRKGFPFEPLYKNMIALRDFPLITISSTQVRNAIRNKQPVNALVPEKVKEYIRDKKLYTTP